MKTYEKVVAKANSLDTKIINEFLDGKSIQEISDKVERQLKYVRETLDVHLGRRMVARGSSYAKKKLARAMPAFVTAELSELPSKEELMPYTDMTGTCVPDSVGFGGNHTTTFVEAYCCTIELPEFNLPFDPLWDGDGSFLEERV